MSEEKVNMVRIAPPENIDGRAMLTQGTKVFLDDGTEVDGVYKVVLTAEVNALWSAVIHCHAKPEPVRAIGTIIRDELPWWNWLARNTWGRIFWKQVETTSLDSSSRSYRRVP